MKDTNKPQMNQEQEQHFVTEMSHFLDHQNKQEAFKPGSPGKRRRKSESMKPHFRIDWRQLSYYHRSSSILTAFNSLLGKNQANFNANDLERLSVHSSCSQSSDDFDSNSKRILNSLDGTFRSGELSAILGPSGAGKSTFLSALFGSKQDDAYGETKVTWLMDSNSNSKSLEASQVKALSRRQLRTVFLPQHDHLLHHLTVYESLYFASKIKNSPDKPSSFHKQNIRRVAKMLKLMDCMGTRCSRLSGGQYKRVSIAQEILSEPDVMILDEPTSGLDAMTCLTTVMSLKSIVSKRPMSIILTIHQPDMDVFNLFDHVYVIAQGGLAIYEGRPQDMVPTLAQANLIMPAGKHNSARFIVENAFLIPEALQTAGSCKQSPLIIPSNSKLSCPSTIESDTSGSCVSEGSSNSSSSSSDDDDDDDDVQLDANGKRIYSENYIKRSVLSLTDVISGTEMSSAGLSKSKKNSKKKSKKNEKNVDKKLLLNIGIRTLDGKLITSEQLESQKRQNQNEYYLTERWNLLKRLNQIQKSKYYADKINHPLEKHLKERVCSSARSSTSYEDTNSELDGNNLHKSAKSDYSSAGALSEKTNQVKGNSNVNYNPTANNLTDHNRTNKHSDLAASLMQLSECLPSNKNYHHSSLQNVTVRKEAHKSHEPGEQFVLDLGNFNHHNHNNHNNHHHHQHHHQQDQESVESSANSSLIGANSSNKKPYRRFDKRLSSKHNSKHRKYPILRHSSVLTHRTWLSIVRDPIFFGIQALLHTTIPILLSIIFGQSQEDGCPTIGNFDLVEFAYSDTDNFIQGTVHSIRQSLGNIGIVFFEMFVLSFSINCITALVFPLDMHVLLKEYRNGWYSLKSYLIGRTLADLPIPVFFHAFGMTILWYLTGQPFGEPTMWRYWGTIVLVIMASLVAQSVGLTIGALLMKSSQSAVLMAAGIVAPFFALSGFIVRIDALPLIAQVAAQFSYLYHLLNGFIVLRYGFGRCQCKEEDFEPNTAHQIPNNLHTMASMWIGTYSNEYTDSSSIMKNVQASQMNRTNIDPNIDVVDKMLTAFKMANSYGHKMENCDDVLPYAMLDFNLREIDIYTPFVFLFLMLIISRFITFSAIYYKVRSMS